MINNDEQYQPIADLKQKLKDYMQPSRLLRLMNWLLADEYEDDDCYKTVASYCYQIIDIALHKIDSPNAAIAGKYLLIIDSIESHAAPSKELAQALKPQPAELTLLRNQHTANGLALLHDHELLTACPPTIQGLIVAKLLSLPNDNGKSASDLLLTATNPNVELDSKTSRYCQYLTWLVNNSHILGYIDQCHNPDKTLAALKQVPTIRSYLLNNTEELINNSILSHSTLLEPLLFGDPLPLAYNHTFNHETLLPIIKTKPRLGFRLFDASKIKTNLLPLPPFGNDFCDTYLKHLPTNLLLSIWINPTRYVAGRRIAARINTHLANHNLDLLCPVFGRTASFGLMHRLLRNMPPQYYSLQNLDSLCQCFGVDTIVDIFSKLHYYLNHQFLTQPNRHSFRKTLLGTKELIDKYSKACKVFVQSDTKLLSRAIIKLLQQNHIELQEFNITMESIKPLLELTDPKPLRHALINLNWILIANKAGYLDNIQQICYDNINEITSILQESLIITQLYIGYDYIKGDHKSFLKILLYMSLNADHLNKDDIFYISEDIPELCPFILRNPRLLTKLTKPKHIVTVLARCPDTEEALAIVRQNSTLALAINELTAINAYPPAMQERLALLQNVLQNNTSSPTTANTLRRRRAYFIETNTNNETQINQNNHNTLTRPF